MAALVVLLGLMVMPSGALAADAGTTGATGERGGQGGGRSAQDVVDAMQPGWNLGNTFDAIGADETAWGNPRVTRELLRNIRAQGFRSIRIPVTWGQHQGPAPDYTIDPATLERVREVVGWALDEGLYVLINMHHDSWQWVSGMPARHDEVLDRYTAAWTQIAGAFRDSSRRLLFESINEPFFDGSSGDAQNAALMHELNAAFHAVVRGSGGRNATRLLVLPTLHTSADQARLDELAATLAELDDPRLVATVHFYGFWPFSVNVAGHTRFDETTRQDLTDVFDRVHETFTARGVPVIIGEYGLLGFDRSTDTVQQGEKLKFFEFLGNYARAKRLTTMLWDNGQHFGRTTFEWSDPSLYRQIRSSWRVASGTASSDQIFVRRGGSPSDATLTLNPNGNRLWSVRHGHRWLVHGRDYTLDGDRLTVFAATLERLTAAREYGTNAVLTLRFSRGVPWEVKVISHDTPVVADAAGTTGGLVIPAAFHGDRLATMEAVYADGSGNAGPHGWTSYKEFGAAFAPDYDAGEITLPAAFFDEVRDGSTVLLTFHFWSGDTVEYTLTRSGTTVTGTAG
ncbi:cellulase family glycosylhydrolase [Streptomyces aidingensis]|uniref:Aryl-phospho-beta-D-glucosidase BglC, GH1 family n=1 Tax=Streptomyces aidingensis TaxID=910347 RepID=A0A1I1F9H5_9ACTN|nr:cellulase family glycosylhydrolase [Streptomyces aidingensis]SFB93740.1 Aryl-phospho-beta-D-glucosidase BglC, GH1 family [Streptomyces aidingensis]